MDNPLLAVLIALYLERDRDLCSFGLTCRLFRDIAHAEMLWRHRMEKNDLVAACRLGYPPFIEAKRATAKDAETFDLLALCLRPCPASREKMREMRHADAIAMNTFATGIRRDPNRSIDEHLLRKIAKHIFH